MFDGKTQSERINPLAASQRRRQGGYEPSTFPVRGNAAKPCSLSTYKDEIVVGDDRLPSALLDPRSPARRRRYRVQRSRDGCLRRRPVAGTRLRCWLLFADSGAFVPPPETR